MAPEAAAPGAGVFAGRSLVAVFAHPDDESLASGGLLAACAARGARVTLVCATRGDLRAGDTDAALGETRVAELARAALVLGLAEVVHLDHPDGYLPWVDIEAFDAALVRELQRLSPDVVVTFGADGLYWHPDHVVVHERTTAAVGALGEYAPALYYVTMPGGQVRRIVESCRFGAAPGETVLGITDPDAFGALAAPPTLVLDVRDVAARKLEALQCHRSQVAGGPFARMRADAAPRLLGVEHYHRAAIPSARDPFIERLPCV